MEGSEAARKLPAGAGDLIRIRPPQQYGRRVRIRPTCGSTKFVSGRFLSVSSAKADDDAEVIAGWELNDAAKEARNTGMDKLGPAPGWGARSKTTLDPLVL